MLSVVWQRKQDVKSVYGIGALHYDFTLLLFGWVLFVGEDKLYAQETGWNQYHHSVTSVTEISHYISVLFGNNQGIYPGNILQKYVVSAPQTPNDYLKVQAFTMKANKKKMQSSKSDKGG